MIMVLKNIILLIILKNLKQIPKILLKILKLMAEQGKIVISMN